MSFFVSESLKDVLDEENLLNNNRVKTKFAFLSYDVNDEKLKSQIEKFKFSNKKLIISLNASLDELEKFYFNDILIDKIVFKEKSIKIKEEYTINSAVYKEDNNYLIELTCYIK